MIPVEFPRPLAVDRVGLKEKAFDIEATAAECMNLARRLDIPEVVSMSATIRIKLVAGGKRIRLKGHVRAALVQICVVTLEPVHTFVDEEFVRLYRLDDGPEETEIVVELDQDDPPDPIEDGYIDMGEAAAEHLALAMDPFPRKEGVNFVPPPEAPLEEQVKPNPFEVLADHRKKI